MVKKGESLSDKEYEQLAAARAKAAEARAAKAEERRKLIQADRLDV